jgi:hypothetical protein
MAFTPCPTCGQYSHSISDDFVGEAHRHFEAMFSHRGDGLPTQHVHSAATRDMAQRLLGSMVGQRARIASLEAEVARLTGERDGAYERAAKVADALGGDRVERAPDGMPRAHNMDDRGSQTLNAMRVRASTIAAAIRHLRRPQEEADHDRD